MFLPKVNCSRNCLFDKHERSINLYFGHSYPHINFKVCHVPTFELHLAVRPSKFDSFTVLIHLATSVKCGFITKRERFPLDFCVRLLVVTREARVNLAARETVSSCPRRCIVWMCMHMHVY